ncbi:DUF4232 domain-containing protein [Kitasatospora sp. NPDC004240]
MQDTRYGKKAARRAGVAAVTAATVALVVTACGPGDDGPAATGAGAAPSVVVTTSAAPGATSPAPAKGGTPSAGAASSGGAAASGSATAGGATAPLCSDRDLKVEARQAKERPPGTGIGAAVVSFTNTSARPCNLQGFPTVAGAGNGAPDKNTPLAVTHSGPAAPVRLIPGGKAWVKLTFVQVQGEADGYCVSGATPVAYPTLVLGLPGAGSHQVALADGLFAECDNKVTTTALLPTMPA